MTIPVLICDDSSFARKQMARALPSNWDVSLSYAKNGLEAMQVLREGKAEVLFLDLNMPEMDGYEVLESVRKEDINTMVVVVSGDVQAEARARVKQLGAMDFIKKPVNKDEVHSLLQAYGILQITEEIHQTRNSDIEVDYLDFFKELANVSMGRGINLLSQLLEVFIPMPIPQVRYLSVDELTKTLQAVSEQCELMPIYQGFIGTGIAGEILLLFNEPDKESISKLLSSEDEPSDIACIEMMMDIASVLSGACLNGLSEQLDIPFSLGHPRHLGQHIALAELIKNNSLRTWEKTLAIEMAFEVEDYRLHCNLLLLFTEESVEKLKHLVSYIN